jgi:hypothetical protein
MAEEAENKNEEQRRKLRAQVSHPYITHQHLKRPERPKDETNEGERDERDESAKGEGACD